jgi:hypothetical protein
MFGRKTPGMITSAQVLPEHTDQTMPVPETHFENGASVGVSCTEYLPTLVASSVG